MSIDYDTLQLIAKVIAWMWMEGETATPEEIADAALDVTYQDSAQQCAEDLGLA